MDPAAEKQRLRKHYISLLAGQDESSRTEHSRIIRSRLVSLPAYRTARSVLAYKAFGGEVDTAELIAQMVEDGKEVIIAERSADVVQLQGSPLDLVLVAGLAFDESGTRLGRGGGFYDRLLASIIANAIALAFEFQIVDNIPSESHDVPLSCIVTEKRVSSPA
jgi:5-formyltetrahydrofolate cyclo-ligase